MFGRTYFKSKRATLVAAAGLSVLASAQAQTLNERAGSRVPARISVTPYVGVYNPIGMLRADSTARFRQLMTMALGARITVPLNQRVALEGSASWTPVSNWVAQSDWQQTVDVRGSVTFLNLCARYVTNPQVAAGDFILSLASGIGTVKRAGPAWEGFSGTTDAALVFGASTRLRPLGSRISYGFDLQSFVTRASYQDYTGQHTRARLHGDLISSFVLTMSL